MVALLCLIPCRSDDTGLQTCTPRRPQHRGVDPQNVYDIVPRTYSPPFRMILVFLSLFGAATASQAPPCLCLGPNQCQGTDGACSSPVTFSGDACSDTTGAGCTCPAGTSDCTGTAFSLSVIRQPLSALKQTPVRRKSSVDWPLKLLWAHTTSLCPSRRSESSRWWSFKMADWICCRSREPPVSRPPSSSLRISATAQQIDLASI